MAKQQHDSHGHEGETGHHITPIPVYIKTLGALIVLTVLTVGASYVDMGKFNIVANLGIACVKGALVMMFFMGLKYDTIINRAYICSSFVALFILVAICASDLWTRPRPDPIAIKASGNTLTTKELPKYEAGSPELVAKGKVLFNTNCAVCHGEGGNGDGAGGASLNPKPRNFHAPASAWTHGNTAHSIYYTLAIGSPGTGMASYKTLPAEDRWALVHYVMSFAPEAQRVGKADDKFDSTIKEDLADTAGGEAPKTKLPIEFAMQRVAH